MDLIFQFGLYLRRIPGFRVLFDEPWKLTAGFEIQMK